MIYFDTDVLVHSVVLRTRAAQLLAVDTIQSAMVEGKYTVSQLVLQELAFVLARIGVEPVLIQENLRFHSKFTEFRISDSIFDRAVALAGKLGFRHINDCLHTAIAETFCEELVTFNAKDFKKISAMTTLKITILA